MSARGLVIPGFFSFFALALAGCGGDVTEVTGDASVAADSARPADLTVTPDGVGPADLPPGADLFGAPDMARNLEESVIERNHHANRDGVYLQPSLTRAVAATLHLDPNFKPAIVGNVYAQPLYVADGLGGKGVFFVATESNNVHAVDETTGQVLWTRSLGMAAGATGAGCGNIAPIGVTATPYIDHDSRTLFVVAAIGTQQTISRYELHALDIDSGSERPGFQVTLTATYNGQTFTAPPGNVRGALIALGNTLYVPFGGHYGDCGQYRGWVMGVPFAGNAVSGSWCTGGTRGGGMWAPGGLASDGASIFAATGNTFGANQWGQGEAILRFSPGPVWSGQPADYFTPSNWKTLDAGDIDLGGSGPLLVDVPGANPSSLVVALGKNGVAYLLDRGKLGGVGTGNGTTGEGLYSVAVAKGAINNVAASYHTAMGTYVVFHAYNGAMVTGCPNGMSGDLGAFRITAASPPQIQMAWCVANQGQGSPMVTTTDGSSETVVWTTGAEASQRLHGWNGDTGAAVYTGGGAGDVMPATVRRFTTPIAVHGKIVAAGDNGLYVFKP